MSFIINHSLLNLEITVCVAKHTHYHGDACGSHFYFLWIGVLYLTFLAMIRLLWLLTYLEIMSPWLQLQEFIHVGN